VDSRSESVGKKIHDAETAKLPYMLVLGDRERDAGGISVRSHEEGDLGQMAVGEFAALVGGASGR
jgi:threonyl-tRNA synthetase